MRLTDLNETAEFNDAYLQGRFHHLNAQLRLGLPDIPVRFKKIRVSGVCTFEQYKATGIVPADSIKIAISSNFKHSVQKLDAILVHEMIHAYFAYQSNPQGHNAQFEHVRKKLSAELGYEVPRWDSERELSDDFKRRTLVVLVRTRDGRKNVALFSRMIGPLQKAISGMAERHGYKINFYKTDDLFWNKFALSAGVSLQRIPADPRKTVLRWYATSEEMIPHIEELENQETTIFEGCECYDRRYLEESELPMDKASRMERAHAMGFNMIAYHGTHQKFNEFDMERGQGNHFGFAPFFADKKAEAKGYADTRSEERGGKGHLLSVLLRVKKPLIIPSTWGVQPRDYKKIDPEEYKIITGGVLPKDTKRERYMVARDAIEQAMDYHYEQHGNYDRKTIWSGIYSRLKAAGYDAIIWEETPADHTDGHYNKIVMLDMSGIRLTSAKFDPAQASSKDLRA